MSAFLDKVVLGAVMFGASWLGTYVFNSPAKAEEAVAGVRKDLTAETLERTNADTKINGQYETLNRKMDAVLDGLGIKYSLPKEEAKAELFSSKAEQVKKAPIITGTAPNGEPLHE